MADANLRHDDVTNRSIELTDYIFGATKSEGDAALAWKGDTLADLIAKIFANPPNTPGHQVLRPTSTADLGIAAVGTGAREFAIPQHWRNYLQLSDSTSVHVRVSGAYQANDPAVDGTISAQATDGDGNVLGSSASITVNNDSLHTIEFTFDTTSLASGNITVTFTTNVVPGGTQFTVSRLQLDIVAAVSVTAAQNSAIDARIATWARANSPSGQIPETSIPAAIMRDSEFTAAAVRTLIGLTASEQQSLFTGATIAGNVMTITREGLANLMLTLPSGTGSNDGVVSSGTILNKRTMRLTLSTGSTVDVDMGDLITDSDELYIPADEIAGANTLVLTPDPALTELTDGLRIAFFMETATTANTHITVNISGLGAKFACTAQKSTFFDVNRAIAQNEFVHAVYNASLDQFVFTNIDDPAGAASVASWAQTGNTDLVPEAKQYVRTLEPHEVWPAATEANRNLILKTTDGKVYIVAQNVRHATPPTGSSGTYTHSSFIGARSSDPDSGTLGQWYYNTHEHLFHEYELTGWHSVHDPGDSLFGAGQLAERGMHHWLGEFSSQSEALAAVDPDEYDSGEHFYGYWDGSVREITSYTAGTDRVEAYEWIRFTGSDLAEEVAGSGILELEENLVTAEHSQANNDISTASVSAHNALDYDAGNALHALRWQTTVTGSDFTVEDFTDSGVTLTDRALKAANAGIYDFDILVTGEMYDSSNNRLAASVGGRNFGMWELRVNGSRKSRGSLRYSRYGRDLIYGHVNVNNVELSVDDEVTLHLTLYSVDVAVDRVHWGTDGNGRITRKIVPEVAAPDPMPATSGTNPPTLVARAYVREAAGVTAAGTQFTGTATGITVASPASLTVPDGADPLWIAELVVPWNAELGRYDPDNDDVVHTLIEGHLQFSEDASSWHYTQTDDDIYGRYRASNGTFVGPYRLDPDDIVEWKSILDVDRTWDPDVGYIQAAGPHIDLRDIHELRVSWSNRTSASSVIPDYQAGLILSTALIDHLRTVNQSSHSDRANNSVRCEFSRSGQNSINMTADQPEDNSPTGVMVFHLQFLRPTSDLTDEFVFDRLQMTDMNGSDTYGRLIVEWR